MSVPTDSLATLANATSFQPTFVIDKPGSYVVQLIVHDPTDASLPDTVTVTTANSAPVANAGLDQPAIVGRLVHLDGNLSQDADDDQLTSLWSFVSRPAGSTATLSDETIVNPTFTPDVPGTYIVQLIVNDGTVDSGPDTVLITTSENVKPVADAGPDQDVVLGAAVHLNGSQSSDADMDPLTYHWALIGAPEGSTVALSSTTIANPTFIPDFAGTYVAQLIVNDSQLDSDPDTVAITVTSPDTTPPAPAEVTQIKVGPITNGQVTVTGSPGSVEGGARVRVTNTHTGHSRLVLAATNGGFSAQLGAQFGDAMTVVVIDNAGNLSPEQTVIAVPDPLLIAPPVDQTVATTVADATTFLYTGPNAIQTGVAPETIQSQRAAVVRGTVLTQAGNPLPGVTITVLNHPEFGQTLSRTDGRFDLVVNGGGLLTVDYQKAGYLPAQRQVHAPWQDYTSLPDVMLIPLDSQVTTIDLASGAPLLVAQGSVVSDANGARQATMLFPAGTTATLVMPDGSEQPLTTLHVRATEYTVGATGPQQMPAELPPSSAYTYAVELNADEALAVGAKEVRFNQPIPLYVDNFVGFPVGTAVPVGSYDRQQGVWMPAPNGKVIKVLSVNGGAAQVDTNGDNVADDASTLTAVGITSAEQQQLAALYPAGRSLWRVSLTYFSAYDCNWPGGPPADAISPDAPPPTTGDEANLEEPDTTSGAGGITYQNQTLSQQQDLAGTPFTLAYQSSRTRGNEAAYVAVIPLTSTTIPPSVKRVQLEIRIAGQQHKQTFAPQPNLSHLFTWDGKDGYGRLVQGRQRLEASIEFVYDVSYQQSAAGVQQAFGLLSGVPLPTPNPRSEVVTGVTWVGALGAWDARAEGLGGWSLDIHHSYDPIGQTLYLGDGTQRSRLDRSSGNSGVGIKTFAGGGSGPLEEGESALDAVIGTVHGIAVSPDGSVYVADTFGDRVRRVDLDGKITTVAGGGTTGVGNIGAGADALTVNVDNPTDVALGADGSLYIAAPLLNRVLRVRDGVLTVFAGSGGNVYNGEGNLATATSLSNPDAVVVASDGSVYLSDIQQRRVRRVGLDGRVYTVAGTGILGTDINIAARQAKVTAQDLAIGPDGLLYIATVEHVLRIDRDGILRRVAGNPSGTGGDGDPAVDANFSFIQGITVAPNNVIFIADGSGHRVRMVTPDGILITVAGTGENGLPMEGARPTQTRISFPQAVATGPDGSLYFSGSGTEPRVFRVRPALPGFSGVGDIVVASKDGGEAYVFSPQGKHLRTVNTLTNAVLYTFGYDSAGRLVTVTDANNNVTTIQRNANEDVTGMTGPYGQNNSITLDANGYLKSITNPNGETTQFSYTADGLLTSVTPPGQPASTFTYDSNGRLQQGSYPDGGSDTLVRSGLTNGYQVQHTTGEGTQTTYQVEFLPDGQQRRTNLLPDGTQQQTVIGTDGSRTLTQPDGMGQTIVQGPDPRFGMLSPTPTALNVTTPGGKNGALTSTRTATLSNPTNPLSLTSQTDTATFNGRTATRTYNGSTRTYTDTSPASRTRTTTLDTQGRVTQQQQGTLTPTQFAYDTRGRLSTRMQGTRSSIMTYDTLGRLATITDPANRVVHFQYDDAGRVTRQTLPDLREITYTYDPNGNVTSIAPPGRPPHVFTYTAVNQEKDYTAPSVNGGGTQQTQYTYNADRQLTLITRPDGQGVQLAYDSAGRLGTQTLPTGQITYGYAPTTGNLTSVATASGQTVHYTYDGSLLTQSQWTGPITGNVTWTYDNNYRRTEQKVNGGNAVTFTYDDDDLLTGAGAMTLTRDSANGLLTGTALGTITDTTTYNGFGEMATYQASAGGTGLLSEQYTRDNLGRLTQKIETIDGVTTTYNYTYDTAGRLTEVTQNGVVTSTYTYDANSNRLTKTTSGSTTTSTYDDQDRLLTLNFEPGALNTSYTYTPNGELVAKTNTSTNTSTTYTYDVLGNLLRVDLPSGDRIDYLVDGENRRIGKIVNGVLQQGFLYEDQLKLVAELDGSGIVVAHFIYGSKANVPDYLIKNGATYRILSDHLGSPRLVMNTTDGTIAQRLDYDEFGNVLVDTFPGFQPFGFAGGIYDRHTKLARFGARDYDAETGRWMAKDPILFGGGNTNLYAYVLADPVNFTDPSGLIESLGEQSASIQLSGTLQQGLIKGIGIAKRMHHLVPSEIFKKFAQQDLFKYLGGIRGAPNRVALDVNFHVWLHSQFRLNPLVTQAVRELIAQGLTGRALAETVAQKVVELTKLAAELYIAQYGL